MSPLKKKGLFTVLAGFLLLIGEIALMIISNYHYEREIGSYWNLAEKASTIEQKGIYIKSFVNAFKDKGLSGDYNALFMYTPDNSFDKNYEALLSLSVRLDDIQKMSITSFEYQTAIQQITQQEQGEAHNMLDVLSGVWLKQHYILVWDWIFPVVLVSACFIVFFGIVLLSIKGDKLTAKSFAEAFNPAKPV